MKIAITGANGFLAGYLIGELLNHHHELVLLSRNTGERFGIPYTVTDYTIDSLKEIFGKGVEGIAHLASTRRVADSLTPYCGFMELTNNLYEAAFLTGCRNIVLSSSISVYSGCELPYSEDTKPAPKNMYGLYKLICENLGEMYNLTKGMHIKNLRLAHLYGANEKNNYMINLFFRQAFAHEQLHVNGKGIARREMMYTKDAAKAVRLALEHPELSGTFNIGSGEALTNEEIANTICAVMSPENTVSVGTESESIASSYMISLRASKLLGFAPSYSLREAAKEIESDMLSQHCV